MRADAGERHQPLATDRCRGTHRTAGTARWWRIRRHPSASRDCDRRGGIGSASIPLRRRLRGEEPVPVHARRPAQPPPSSTHALVEMTCERRDHRPTPRPTRDCAHAGERRIHRRSPRPSPGPDQRCSPADCPDRTRRAREVAQGRRDTRCDPERARVGSGIRARHPGPCCARRGTPQATRQLPRQLASLRRSRGRLRPSTMPRGASGPLTLHAPPRDHLRFKSSCARDRTGSTRYCGSASRGTPGISPTSRNASNSCAPVRGSASRARRRSARRCTTEPEHAASRADPSSRRS